MTSFSINHSAPIVVAFVITSLAPLATRAQSTELPPARTYHTDQYGQQTKVVKERWRDNSNGEKQGIYLLYNFKGLPITKYTYTNGLKNGPAFIIRDDEFYSISFRLTMKFMGSFVNNKEEGWWEVYNVGTNGEVGSLDRRMKYVAGNLEFITTYRNGGMTAIYKYANGRKNGLARLYGATKEEYATGEYNNGTLVGTWNNAGLEANKIVYRKNGKLIFENGELSSVINPDGSIRSLVAEKAQKEAELQRVATSQKAAEQARALDMRLSSVDPVNLYNLYTDSYALTEFGKTKLDTLAKQLNMRRHSPIYRVQKLLMFVHTNPPMQSASEVSEKMLYILSINRAFVIKQYLFEKLEDKRLEFAIFPCGGGMEGKSSGVKIGKGQDVGGEYVLKANDVSEKLASKYGIKFDNQLISSTLLQENILATVRAYFSDGTVRGEMLRKASGEGYNGEYLEKIPSELWLTTIKNVLPNNYDQVEGTAQFRDKIETLFMEMNKKYGMTLTPAVLFTDDLSKRTK